MPPAKSSLIALILEPELQMCLNFNTDSDRISLCLSSARRENTTTQYQ